MADSNRYKQATKNLGRLVIEHPNFTDALGLLKTQAEFSLPGQVFVVHGPPGCGVTALINKFTRDAVANCRITNPYHAIYYPVPEARAASRQWAGTWENGLRSLNAPRLGQIRRASESVIGLTVYNENAIHVPGDAHRFAFQHALHQRECRYLSITNAHVLLKGLKEEDLAFPIKVFHQLAKTAHRLPACVILGGHSSLLQSLAVSAHANLHTTEIEVKPYSANDVAVFTGILAELERSVGDVLAPNALSGHAEQIYSKTLGCVGWVKKALNTAIAKAEHASQPQVSWKLVSKELPTKRDTNLIRKEIDLRNLLSNHSPINYTLEKSTQKPRKVGHRGPETDEVGTPGGPI
jgi:hypothetical protein